MTWNPAIIPKLLAISIENPKVIRKKSPVKPRISHFEPWISHCKPWISHCKPWISHCLKLSKPSTPMFSTLPIFSILLLISDLFAADSLFKWISNSTSTIWRDFIDECWNNSILKASTRFQSGDFTKKLISISRCE